MNPSTRRTVLKVALSTAATTALIASRTGLATAATATELRIGWQKGARLAVIKARGVFERTLGAKGVGVKWLEFPAGPQMLEALNVGSIDLGDVGETPPVFAQAAGASLLYVGYAPPAAHAEALLVQKDSPIKSVAELKGKRVVLNKGSNVHYLLVRLLEQAGLKYGSDVDVVFLPPAEARAAFERGSVAAWAIWDPYATAAEVQSGARRLADAVGVANNHNFIIAARPFVEKHPDAMQLALQEIDINDKWAEQNLDEAVRVVAPQIGLSQEIVKRAFGHYSFGVSLLSSEVVRSQQRIADAFYELKLIPKRLDVSAVVWRG